MNLNEEKSKLEREFDRINAEVAAKSFEAKIIFSKIKKLTKLIEQSNEVLNDKGAS